MARKKVREVFRVEGSHLDRLGDHLDEISDARLWTDYDTLDDAIEVAKECNKDFEKMLGKGNFRLSICMGEWEDERGNVLGESTCLSLEDLGVEEVGR
jgi:hypothetical protein